MTSLRIYADEDVNIAIVEGLRRRGIEAYSFRDFKNFSLSDEEQIAFANKNNFVVLTHDVDFLRIIHEGRINHKGILFVAQTKEIGEIVRKIEYIASILSQEDMINHIEFL